MKSAQVTEMPGTAGMRVLQGELAGLLVIEPRVLEDDRGFFYESWQSERYRACGIEHGFVQDNISSSRRGVLRGLHFQNPQAQAKLVAVVHGAVWDVVVDIRVGSPTFGRWMGMELSAENRRQVYVPEGFAHGFVALSDVAVFAYKCSRYYAPEAELAIRWNDPDIGIEWPLESPLLSAKDAAAPLLRELPRDRLFSAAPPAPLLAR